MLTVTNLKGRFYNEHGQVNTSPLVASVALLPAANGWTVMVTSGAHSPAFVNFVVPSSLFETPLEEETPIAATGFLYGDAATEQFDENGRLIYNSQNQTVRRAPIVHHGDFPGTFAHHFAPNQARIRVDSEHSLAFYLEAIVTRA